MSARFTCAMFGMATAFSLVSVFINPSILSALSLGIFLASTIFFIVQE